MNFQFTTENNNTLGGTLGGTLLVLFNLNVEDVTKTAILAATGAIVSFLVSYGLAALAKRLKNFKKRKT